MTVATGATGGTPEAGTPEAGTTEAAAVAAALRAQRLTLAVAESLTGGLLGARLTDAAGASSWFRGGVIAYAGDVKREVLGVAPGPVVSPAAAEAMARGAARVLRADVGLSVTGVAGPGEQDGQPVGTVWIGSWLSGAAASESVHLRGDRAAIRDAAAAAAMRHLGGRLETGR